jgi:hypothetical protein
LISFAKAFLTQSDFDFSLDADNLGMKAIFHYIYHFFHDANTGKSRLHYRKRLHLGGRPSISSVPSMMLSDTNRPSGVTASKLPA